MPQAGYIRIQAVGFIMPHENPRVLITNSELLVIEEGLSTLEREFPAKRPRHLGAIAGVVSKVRERRP